MCPLRAPLLVGVNGLCLQLLHHLVLGLAGADVAAEPTASVGEDLVVVEDFSDRVIDGRVALAWQGARRRQNDSDSRVHLIVGAAKIDCLCVRIRSPHVLVTVELRHHLPLEIEPSVVVVDAVWGLDLR